MHLFVFSPNAEKYGPEKTPYLDTFYTLNVVYDCEKSCKENILIKNEASLHQRHIRNL